MSRRHRWNSDDGGSTTGKFGNNEKRVLEGRIDRILARSISFTKCPTPIEKLAEVWNSYRDQEIVGAVSLLSARGAVTRLYRESQVYFAFSPPGWALTFSHPGDRESSRFINIGSSTAYPTWDDFVNRMGDSFGEFYNWAVQAHNIAVDINQSMETLRDVMRVVSTAGQLCRVVPEMLHFVGENSRNAFHNQKKRSPMPDGYYQLNLDRVREMNDFISKCQLMPGSDHDELFNMSKVTWASRVNENGKKLNAKCHD